MIETATHFLAVVRANARRSHRHEKPTICCFFLFARASSSSVGRYSWQSTATEPHFGGRARVFVSLRVMSACVCLLNGHQYAWHKSTGRWLAGDAYLWSIYSINYCAIVVFGVQICKHEISNWVFGKLRRCTQWRTHRDSSENWWIALSLFPYRVPSSAGRT